MKAIDVSQLPIQCSDCNSRCLSAFSELKPEHNHLMDVVRRWKILKVGETISFDLLNNHEFFCVKKGYLRLDYGDSSNFQSVRICGPGDLVGFKMTSSYQAVAIEESALCSINMEAFTEFQKTVPELSFGIIQRLINTISNEDEILRGLGNHSIKNRIASTLLNLSKRFGTSLSEGILIDVSVDRKTLARMSGTVTESLARVLTDLEDAKIISRQGRLIQITNQKELVRIAESK